MLSYLELVYLVFPLLSGFFTGFVCKVDKTSGETVKFRPPSWFFSIAWVIIYILLGISWVISSRQNKYNSILYVILTLLLTSWIIFYTCLQDKKSAMYILLLSLIATISCSSIGNTTSKIMISPLLGWLIFALIMNTTEIQTIY